MSNALRNKLFKLKYKFNLILDKPSGFLIFTSLILILISSSIILILSDKINPFYESLFSTSATIIATIFTISLTLIGIQYYVQNIPYELLKYFFKSKFTISMFGMYIGSIIYNLLMLGLGIRNMFCLIISIAFTIVSMVYLLSYFYYLNGSLQEVNILNLITKNLKNKSYNSDYTKYEALKDLIIKSVKDNKNSLYKKSLDIFFRKQFEFISQISMKNIDKNYNYDTRHSEVEQLIHFFLGFQKQIFYELIDNDRQLFLYLYVDLYKELQEKTFVLLSPRPYYELRDHFNKIGDKILEKRFDEIYLFYSHKMRDLTKFEFNHVDKVKLVSYYDITKRDANESQLEKTERVLIHMLYESFARDRLNFLTKLSLKAIKNNVDTLNWFPKSILCDILDNALHITSNKGMRWDLINNIMYMLRQIHDENIKKNNFHNFMWLDLHTHIEQIKDEEEISKLGGFITREYCLAQLDLVKISARETVHDLSVDCAFLKDKDQNHIVIKLIMETFDKILTMFSKKEISGIEKDYLSYAVHSCLGKSDKNNKLVRLIIKKYKLKPSKNVYMMGVFMGKKSDFQKNNMNKTTNKKNNHKN